MERLIPTLTSLQVVLVEDNARKPVHSLTATSSSRSCRPNQRRHRPQPNRWETSLAQRKSVQQTFQKMTVLSPSPIAIVPGDCASTTSTLNDTTFRSSLEAKKPCRRPSVEEDAECERIWWRNSDVDTITRCRSTRPETAFRSSLEARKPRRQPSLTRLPSVANANNNDAIGDLQFKLGPAARNYEEQNQRRRQQRNHLCSASQSERHRSSMNGAVVPSLLDNISPALLAKADDLLDDDVTGRNAVVRRAFCIRNNSDDNASQVFANDMLREPSHERLPEELE